MKVQNINNKTFASLRFFNRMGCVRSSFQSYKEKKAFASLRLCVPLIVFLLCVQLSQAQAFQETFIRDLAKMKNNYGNAVADYDQDGDLDIFMVAYEEYERGKPETWSRLLENKGSGWFEDATETAGFREQYNDPALRANKLGAAWGDYDNDGFPDLLLTHAGSVQLFHNQQDGTFEEVPEIAAMEECPTCVNTSGLWWDYDRDGFLDFYISDYGAFSPNRLYRNLGDGTFQNMTYETGLGDDRRAWSSAAFDVNGDGWLDLYVNNDYGFSRLYINEEGKTFREATYEYGLQNTGNGMGFSIGDYNNDGYFDIYVTNISELLPNPLYTGNASGVFTNEFEAQNVGYGNWAWGTHFFDADHDGDEDLYMVNGFQGLIYNNKFFKNNLAQGKEGFTDWSTQAACDGIASGMSLEVFDYDEDGDLDILVSNTDDHPYLYQNVGRSSQTNWLQVELEGTTSNRNAFGAVVKAKGKGRLHQRYHHGANIMSQSIKPVHLGLGDMKIIDTLLVIWPTGEEEAFYDVSTNQKIKIVETPKVSTATKNQTPNTLKINSISPNPFRDFVVIDIELTQSSELNYQLFSSTGQQVGQGNSSILPAGKNQIQWTVGAGLSEGLYLYQIQIGEEVKSGKLVLKR
ncbi:MAG: FG-GAP-like repeat-containing protein [Bacteroidota bacterium]